MMRPFRFFVLPALVAGLAAATVSTPVSAQEVAVRSNERGWVGISYDLQTRADGRVEVVVTEVGTGSPAHRAGIRPGDQLVAINGHPARTNFGNLPLQIHPEDSVHVVVSRQGRPLTVHLVAAHRPGSVALESTVTLTLTADSMAESMYRAMDSLRLTLVSTSGDSVRVIGARGPRYEFRVRTDTLLGDEDSGVLLRRGVAVDEAVRLRQATLEEVRAPFGFWVFRTEAHDSLRQAMEAFNQDFRALRVREADRLQPFTDAAGRVHLVAAEEELGDLRGILKSYAERSVALRQAIGRAAQEAARPRTGYVVTWQEPDERVREPREARSEFFGPLTPYALGQNRVAGAEIVDLRPELAEYFEVEGGVLVVDVLPGTPMAQGGIEPGDVITHLDRVSIRSLQELRLGLSRAGDTLPLTVVRKGQRLQLLMHR